MRSARLRDRVVAGGEQVRELLIQPWIWAERQGLYSPPEGVSIYHWGMLVRYWDVRPSAIRTRRAWLRGET